MTKLYLGLDGGGTKTKAIVVDESTRIVGEGAGGPSNYLRIGMEEASANLNEVIAAATTAASVTVESIEFAYFGIAGAEHPKHRANLIKPLRRVFPRNNFTVDTDARIALTGAVGFGAGIVVVAGTGSVAYGRNEDGGEAFAGGWGPTLGDEGSGYSIARRGLSAVLRQHDGRGPATVMTKLLCDEYEICDPDELPLFVYDPTTHVDDIARYSRMVSEAAGQGDKIARDIFFTEGKELGMAVIAVARTLGLLQHSFPVAYVGGAFNAGELLLSPMRDAIHEAAPKSTLQAPLEPPVLGAARMAQRSMTREQRSAR